MELLDVEDNSLWKMAKVLRNKWSPVLPVRGEVAVAHTDAQRQSSSPTAWGSKVSLITSMSIGKVHRRGLR